jgi:hypothetical protein
VLPCGEGLNHNNKRQFSMHSTALDTRQQVLTSRERPLVDLANGFSEAAAGGFRELNLRIGGYPVRIRIAGSRWARIVEAAMGHLVCDLPSNSVAALTIDAWDADETGVPGPLPALQANAPPILMRMSADGELIGEERPHSLVWLDRGSSRILGCIESTLRLNLDERARPFHKLLSPWLEDRGIQFVHSGLIAHAGRGVLFVGNGGAGKSTSSIACLRAGMGYLGDDFIGLQTQARPFIGHGFYASCLLNVHHVKRFPDLLPLCHAPNHAHEDKFVLYLTEAFPNCLQQHTSVDAIVLPHVVDSEVTTFRAATKMAALKAIAPTSVMYLPRPNRVAFERLSQLVESAPAYWLDLGRRIDLIPAAVQQLAEQL